MGLGTTTIVSAVVELPIDQILNIYRNRLVVQLDADLQHRIIHFLFIPSSYSALMPSKQLRVFYKVRLAVFDQFLHSLLSILSA